MATTMVQINPVALRGHRTRAGLTQAALAAEAGLSWSYLSNLERGHRANVRRPALRALADALNIQSDALLAA